ncbi:S41 family peptidase [Limnohabitans sp. Jir72]|uniref:S41 family peptidase n=1 Tax=Limnohabitans sp. Jir72 TaxID=1977909 RepID=UPI000D375D13|nr:S41 family peptidase [Limnohabitans sp. Jir72]PUE26428.1 hypothetical protein B9Z52_16285 [Limnohabitans sp. Jir72]
MRAYGTVCCWVVLALAGCGGGGGGGTAEVKPEKTSTELAQICSVDNILSGDASTATQKGTLADERNWVKAYLQERYFWYKDIPAVNASDAQFNLSNGSAWQNFANSLSNYFYAQLTPKRTASGAAVDKFSFVQGTYSWNQFSQGAELGYGWLLSEQGSGSARRIWISHVFPINQAGFAAQTGLKRGDEIVGVDGYAVNVTANATSVDRVLTPAVAGTHSFLVKRQGQTNTETVFLTASTTVLPQAEHKVVTDSQGVKWGYLLFNAHVESAQAPLLAALSDFKTQKVDQLVVDLRYNGGGYLALASAVAYGVAGPVRTQGKTFETVRHSDKRTSEDESLPFYSADMDGKAIESLSLSRIYVLTTDQTCSASESIINGLRGVDVEVVQIGGTTCGKPYGFVPQDNCGITYAAMEFEGVNNKGQGGYADGFVPQCAASDDLLHALGDPGEAMFATAISRHRGLACPSVAASLALGSTGLSGLGTGARKLIRPEWQRGKIVTPYRPGA